MSRQEYKNIMGFTLVELVITIVIIAILSLVSVAVHREYVKKAIFTEGKVLVGAIVKAQRLYYMQNNSFFSWDSHWLGGFCEEFDIDARSNKYFRDFSTEPFYVTRASKSGQNKSSQRGAPISSQDYVRIRSFYFPNNDNIAWIVSVDLYADGSISDFDIYEGEWYYIV